MKNLLIKGIKMLSGFGEGLTELGRNNSDVVALCRFNRFSEDEYIC